MKTPPDLANVPDGDLIRLRSMLRQLVGWKIHHHCCGELDYDTEWHEHVAAINELATRITVDPGIRSDASSLWRSLDALDGLLAKVERLIESE